MSESTIPDWLQRCLTCKHCYKVKSDADEIRCRTRSGKCEYKPYKAKVVRNKYGRE